MAFVPAPNQIIISGPSAILGKLLSTTIYGSKTRRKNDDHQKITAIKIPSDVAIKKPKIVSYRVVKICLKSSPLPYSVAVVLYILDGLLNKKLSTKLKRVNNSHNKRKITSTKICVEIITSEFFFSFFKYSRCFLE